MKQTYAVIFEQSPNNFCASVPDLPGCVSVGETWDEVQAMVREAIAFHVEDMVEHGEAFPEPTTSVEEALARYNEVLSSLDEETLALFADAGPEPSPVIRMVDVEINLPQPARSQG